MALPASGTISLNKVNTELQRPATQAINMNDTNVRTLAGKASGAIAMSDLLGKSWWALKYNGFGMTGVSATVYSAVGEFKPISVYFNMNAYNGNDFGIQYTTNVEGKRQDNGVWEIICTNGNSVPAKAFINEVETFPVIAGKENIIYTQLRVGMPNRESTVQLASYMGKG